ncbi:MAG: hypothetical protein ACI9TH_000628 [Kiritimatiellia bacterium]|jgi:hypothetical protein
MTDNELLPTRLEKLQKTSLTIGFAVLATMVLYGLLTNQSTHFFQSYLIGYLFALSFTLGGLGWLCIHHLSGGGWGYVGRRVFEAGAKTIIPMAVLFLPILFTVASGNSDVYPWLDKAWAAGDHVVAQKLRYLNASGWIIRALVCFVIWIVLATLMNKWSERQDATGDIIWRKKMKCLAGPALLIYVLTMTVASVDWVMSLEPGWFSSIYGAMFFIGQGLSTMAFTIVFVIWLSKYQPMKTELKVNRLHDLGNLQFAFIILWAYMEVSQFIIIWSAGLPEEITWFMNRSRNGFEYVSTALVMMQFFIPFFVLISRGVKRVKTRLVKIAIAIICVRVLDLWWIIAPSLHPGVAGTGQEPVFDGGFPFFFTDILAPIGFGALWFGLFLRNFRKMPVLPTKDPMFSEHFDFKEAV